MAIDYLKKILTARVYDVARKTELELAPALSQRLGNQILLKREDNQPVFSFKLRGAYNKMAQLSPAEVDRKRTAIFKHQSQKDSAPFPGQDDREFWQRVEERNKGTAAQLDRLGLAEYFAMEAYVVD